MLRQVTVIMPDSGQPLDDDDPKDQDPRGHSAQPDTRDNMRAAKNAEPPRAIPSAAASPKASVKPSARVSAQSSQATTNSLPDTDQAPSTDQDKVNQLDNILAGEADFNLGDERIDNMDDSPSELDDTVVGDDDKFDRFDITDGEFISNSGKSNPENDSGLDVNLSALAKKRRQQ